MCSRSNFNLSVLLIPLLVAIKFASASAEPNILQLSQHKYNIGDCAAYSEFANNDYIWEIVFIGKKQYGFRAYGDNGKIYSEDFSYFDNYKAPFKRECVKSKKY